MKKFLLLATILFSCCCVFAQDELEVQHNDKGLYVNHTVAPKENFYSIGRLFNVYPKDIEAFNGLDMKKGLNVGQVVRVPLNTVNFSQKSESGRPVYYEVGEKEGLYRVSVKNKGVLMADLRKWNHLSNDNIRPGQKLIVGFLVSPEAGHIVASHPSEPEKKTVEQPKQEVAVQPSTETPKEKKAEIGVTTREPEKKEAVADPSTQTTQPVAVNDGNGGYFKSLFDKQIKVQPLKQDETATAGIFKTASGWQDAKYYALMDHVEPGTIVRITNPTNNKAVYAKVLGEMSGIRQNQGYDIRMSNAAASALNINDTDKFIVRVDY
ncbi:MAG: LysM peptidoglycan-binding domain-containing protein [Flavisolibacter sp.]